MVKRKRSRPRRSSNSPAQAHSDSSPDSSRVRKRKITDIYADATSAVLETADISVNIGKDGGNVGFDAPLAASSVQIGEDGGSTVGFGAPLAASSVQIGKYGGSVDFGALGEAGSVPPIGVMEDAQTSAREERLNREEEAGKLKTDSSVKIGKDGGSVGFGAPGEASSVPPIGVKEDTQTSAREKRLNREEEAGVLKFDFVSVANIGANTFGLIILKLIFAKQLPNMHMKYIEDLIFDNQKFGEIAFCAITTEKQGNGYGGRLMYHLKQHARDVDQLTHFLTYAYNNAVDYFTKQGVNLMAYENFLLSSGMKLGFTTEITLKKELWEGHIKYYDGRTLMECKLDPKLPNTDSRHKQVIDDKIRELSIR